MSAAPNSIWEGRKIIVAHIPDYCANVGISHIEVRCDEPLPITKTGYKSHFLPAVHLENYDGPLDFVRQWLDFEAAKPNWTKSEAASPQLSLF